MRMINLAFLHIFVLIFGLHLVSALLSRRAKCAIECYAKCANAGTPKAVYCNCPVNIETDECNSINENLLTEKTVERLIESESSYKDVRTILMRVESVPNAFIYIFEFSVQSAEMPIWTFAGASSAPQITLALPDACRDYQFRLLVVLRSTDPINHLVVFRPKAIPAQFPPFIVPKESIHMDRPKQSGDGQTLHFSISWQHPAGYDDTDIYGYSPPTAYPIRCQTPEDRLSQPRLELVQGGARLHLALPVDVLQERCRIYMEVRMLPRCVRIEPFDIQISVELDCQKFPNLRYCRKEDQSPQCTDVVDLWGKENGKAIVVWQKPGNNNNQQPWMGILPLFYVLNWGPAQSQGTPPFVTRRIVQNEQIRVPGNTTKAELAPLPGVQYGLQICAFYTEKEWTEQQQMDEEQNPFHIVPVIPFTCTPCQNRASASDCIDCSKIEESSSSSTQKQMPISTPTLVAQTPDPVECIGPICAATNHSSVHFISSDTVVLDVFGAKVSVPMPSSSDSTEMPTNTTKRWWEENDEVKKETKKEEEEDDDGRRKNEEILPGERPFKQRHSKTHLSNEPIALETGEVKSTTTVLALTNGGVEIEMNKTTMMMIGTNGEEAKLDNKMPKCTEDNSEWKMREAGKVKEEVEENEEKKDKGKMKDEDEMDGKKKEDERKEERDERKKKEEEKANKTIMDEWREENVKSGSRKEEVNQPKIKITQRRRDEEEIGSEIYRLTENGKNTSGGHFAENEVFKMGQIGNSHQKNQRRLHQPKLMMEEKNDGDESTKEGGEKFIPNSAETISASTIKMETFDTTKRIDDANANSRSQSSSTISINRMDFVDGGNSQNANNIEEEEPSATFGGIYTMDSHQKLMLAGPIFFLLGLIAGLALFCTAFIRRCRRHRHSPLPSYSASLTPIPRKYLPPPFSGGGYANKFPARSVLAARTAASSGQQQQCFGQNGAPVGFIGTPIGTISMPTGIPSSQSCPSSNTSTASSATVESRLIGTNGSNSTNKSHHQQKRQNVHPTVAHQNPHRPLHPPRPSHPADQNFFADNTARFFMSSATNSNNGTGSTKNVHF